MESLLVRDPFHLAIRLASQCPFRMRNIYLCLCQFRCNVWVWSVGSVGPSVGGPVVCCTIFASQDLSFKEDIICTFNYIRFTAHSRRGWPGNCLILGSRSVAAAHHRPPFDSNCSWHTLNVHYPLPFEYSAAIPRQIPIYVSAFWILGENRGKRK